MDHDDIVPSIMALYLVKEKQGINHLDIDLVVLLGSYLGNILQYLCNRSCIFLQGSQVHKLFYHPS